MSEQHVLATLFSLPGILGHGRFKDMIYEHILLFRICIYVYGCIYIYMHICVYVYMRMCVHVYVFSPD